MIRDLLMVSDAIFNNPVVLLPMHPLYERLVLGERLHPTGLSDDTPQAFHVCDRAFQITFKGLLLVSKHALERGFRHLHRR